MIFIAHRGNTSGPQPTFENTQAYMEEAYAQGYGVEVDVQLWRGALYYGHDSPQDAVVEEFITKPNVFCHAKTPETVAPLIAMGCHTFFHQEDQLTITSSKKIWCYPGVFVRSSEAIWLDLQGIDLPKDIPAIYGICGDRDSVLNRVKK